MLQAARSIPADTTPELLREISAAVSPTLPGARAKIKVEPCFNEFRAPLEHNSGGVFLYPLKTGEEKTT